jgi:hypothetical protein
MKYIFEKLLATLWKPVTKSLRIQAPTPAKEQEEQEVKEETPTKVDLRATRQIDPRLTRPIGKL